MPVSGSLPARSPIVPIVVIVGVVKAGEYYWFSIEIFCEKLLKILLWLFAYDCVCVCVDCIHLCADLHCVWKRRGEEEEKEYGDSIELNAGLVLLQYRR